MLYIPFRGEYFLNIPSLTVTLASRITLSLMVVLSTDSDKGTFRDSKFSDIYLIQ